VARWCRTGCSSFLALEQVDSSGTRVADARVTSGGISGSPWTRYDYKQTRAYAKIDWQISDNHLLEFTGAQDKARTNGNIYGYDYVNREVGSYVGREAKNAVVDEAKKQNLTPEALNANAGDANNKPAQNNADNKPAGNQPAENKPAEQREPELARR
jgi:hypothetical protein